MEKTFCIGRGAFQQLCTISTTTSTVAVTTTTTTKRQYPRIISSGGQRRFLSNKAGNNGNHKPRRKRPSQLPLTTREKLHYRNKPLTSRTTLATSLSQALQQTVHNAKQGKLIDEELVAERMTDRLSWARGRLYSFWTEVAGSQSSEGAAVAGRPRRYELVMDANWWFWNILMAMTPAVLLAAYCEFVVHPRMAQEKAEQEAQEAAGGGHNQNMKPSLASATTASGNGSDGASISAEGFIPPSGPTMQESLSHLLRWMQGLPPSEENESTESASVTGTPPPVQPSQPVTSQQQPRDHPQLEQLRVLKQKIEAMEAQLLAGEQQPKSGEEVNDPSISPILQRRMNDSSSNHAPRQLEKTNVDDSTSQGIVSDTLHWMEQLQETAFTYVPDAIAKSLPLPPWSTHQSSPSSSTASTTEIIAKKTADSDTSCVSPEASTSVSPKSRQEEDTVAPESQESPSGQDTTHDTDPQQGEVEAKQSPVPSTGRPWWKVW
eukprot:Nitzschia sp. Nitz4//scaffold346_size17405//5577//7049//NITZ4_008829-RA/size17405-processed-gene-0.0-mRNA-1//1//CDS//3329548647//1845//frame0